ncbi:hypothetical protein J6590_060508 [Homalodisca vitripennis]|nr:hypothetical protein J6590_060508 [Homalodisca vitripennis]
MFRRTAVREQEQLRLEKVESNVSSWMPLCPVQYQYTVCHAVTLTLQLCFHNARNTTITVTMSPNDVPLSLWPTLDLVLSGLFAGHKELSSREAGCCARVLKFSCGAMPCCGEGGGDAARVVVRRQYIATPPPVWTSCSRRAVPSSHRSVVVDTPSTLWDTRTNCVIRTFKSLVSCVASIPPDKRYAEVDVNDGVVVNVT